MDVCMDIWMEKLQIKKFGVKYVHNLGCFAARFMWSYSLGNLTLRTFACLTLINSAGLALHFRNIKLVLLSAGFDAGDHDLRATLRGYTAGKP